MSTPTETFNLTLPPYEQRAHGRDYSYLSSEQRATYDATTKARVVAMLALVRAISPELVPLIPYMGAWRELFNLPFEGGPRFIVRDMLKTNQLELRLERYGTQAFRRVKVDPKTGAIDPRIVVATHELVAEAKAMVQREAASQVRAASDAELKAAAFAYAASVVAAAGLTWAYGQTPDMARGEGTVRLDGAYGNEARIVGRTMKVELNGLDVDHLPALAAFVRGLGETKPDKRLS